MSLDNYLSAGKIAATVREEARRKYHVGSTLLEICESLEKRIRELKGEPAFPVNTSLNEIAAHYTAEPNDVTTVNEGDVIKIDIGVHVDGYVADTAVTVSYNRSYDLMVKAAESALAEAVKMSRVDTKVSDIGRVIEMTITKSGYRPIQNLSGHSLKQYTVHAGKSIPNIRTFGSSFSLSSDEAYAIEPFATLKEGQGVVYDGRVKNIFGISSRKPSKDKDADELLESIWNRYRTLPFALRWLLEANDESKVRRLVELLLKRKNLHAYPILVEGAGKTVVQAEHTIIPTASGPTVITA
ncbi:MAG TPA: type II methionyl aminopeptidase [Nitrososphaera sp.]|nr:type II methionyl aminopeptidase [Nitrososphaera sp.]